MTKILSIGEARSAFAETLEECQDEQIVITRHGKPIAIVRGCQGQDLDDILFFSNMAVWRKLKKSLADPGGVSLAEARKKLAARRKAGSRRSR